MIHWEFGILGGLLGGVQLVCCYIHVLWIYTNNMIYLLYTNEGKWEQVCLLSGTTS